MNASTRTIDDLEKIARVLNRILGRYDWHQMVQMVQSVPDVCDEARQTALAITERVFSAADYDPFLLTLAVVIPMNTRVFILRREQSALVSA